MCFGMKVDYKSPTRMAPVTRPPSFMRSRRIHGLDLDFDEAALSEYEADREGYDEVFREAWAVHGEALRRVGQCPIWLHGLRGVWTHGHDVKRRDGFDLGPAERGIAFHGNMIYEGYGEQGDSIFIINLPAALLGHPTVLVHELTHHFHLRVGPERLPRIRRAWEEAVARRREIEARFTIANPIQFDATFANEFEFFAYLMEAYHCRPAGAADGGGPPGAAAPSGRVAFAASAFPTTHDELRALDEALQLDLVATLEDAMAQGVEC